MHTIITYKYPDDNNWRYSPRQPSPLAPSPASNVYSARALTPSVDNPSYNE